jgi:hypothetical protein
MLEEKKPVEAVRKCRQMLALVAEVVVLPQAIQAAVAAAAAVVLVKGAKSRVNHRVYQVKKVNNYCR